MAESLPIDSENHSKDLSALDTAAAVQAQDETKATGNDQPHGLRLFLVVFALLLCMFLVALDLTIVATAIPSITDEFHSLADIGWYGAAFFITLAVFQALWGKAYKHFNLKLVFLITVLLFEVGSLICGVAQNSITLIVGRAIAGLGGAGVTGGIYTIIAFIVPPPKVPAYLGLIGAVFSVASVAGPLLGGVFSGEVTWRWAFYINLPIGAVSILLVLVLFHTPTAVKPAPIAAKGLLFVTDIPGIALSLGALICFTIAMQRGGVTESWSSPNVVGTLVGFVVMVIVFAIVEWRSGENAMLIPRLLKNRTIAAFCVFIFFLNACNLSILYNLPQYFQVINGVTPTFSGIRNLPMIFTTAFSALPSGALLGRSGHYQPFLIFGSAMITLGAGLIYTLDQDSSIGKIIGYQIIVGVGIGSSIQVPVTAAQAFSKPEDIAVVTAVILFFQLATGAIWVSAAQAVLSNRLIAVLKELAPNLNPADVLAVGATELRNVFHGADLDHVLQSYMIGLKDAWAMSIGLGGMTFLASFLGERKSLKSSKPSAIEENGETNTEAGVKVDSKTGEQL
ncbi:major facilitator superfamily transporter [Seiridium cupressi]